GFEFAQDDLTQTATLIVRVDAHAFDFCAFRACAAKGSHSHEDAIPFADQKFSLLVEIRFFDGIDIIVPRTTPQVGSRLLKGMHMQIFDSLSIGRRVTAQGEHETYPHITIVLRILSVWLYNNTAKNILQSTVSASSASKVESE